LRGFNFTTYTHTWLGEDGERLTVSILNEVVLTTTSSGLDGATQHHVSAGPGITTFGSSNENVRRPLNWNWLFLVGLLCVAAVLYGVRELINRFSPFVRRDVRVSEKVEHRRGRYGMARSYVLGFTDIKTGRRIRKTLPFEHEYLFNFVNYNDEGVLITQGTRLVSFTRR